jgi:type III pantothenate kinase
MRLLALSLGNTSLFGGVFADGKLGRTFRGPQEVERVVPGPLDHIVLCSVVPARTAATVRTLARRHQLTPLLLTAASPHGLKIGYTQPRTLGTDRLAAALGARTLFPGENVIVVDCGTATTVTALHRDGTLLGGAILPGLSLWPDLLAERTAQLPRIALRRPASPLGRSTAGGIAAGIFHGHAGAIREVVARVRTAAFGRARVRVVGTGGHAPRFARENLFATLEPALILHGLRAFAESVSPV